MALNTGLSISRSLACGFCCHDAARKAFAQFPLVDRVISKVPGELYEEIMLASGSPGKGCRLRWMTGMTTFRRTLSSQSKQIAGHVAQCTYAAMSTGYLRRSSALRAKLEMCSCGALMSSEPYIGATWRCDCRIGYVGCLALVTLPRQTIRESRTARLSHVRIVLTYEIKCTRTLPVTRVTRLCLLTLGCAVLALKSLHKTLESGWCSCSRENVKEFSNLLSSTSQQTILGRF